MLGIFSCKNKGGMALEDNTNKGNSCSFGVPSLTKT